MKPRFRCATFVTGWIQENVVDVLCVRSVVQAAKTEELVCSVETVDWIGVVAKVVLKKNIKRLIDYRYVLQGRLFLFKAEI